MANARFMTQYNKVTKHDFNLNWNSGQHFIFVTSTISRIQILLAYQ